jgi:hypothetical protein
VVAKLLKTEQFNAAKGWGLRLWSRKMALPNKKKELIEVECKRPYIINTATGDIITCQNKAWMDSAGIAMWCDLDFGPRTKAATGKALMVWDNCGPHKVESVRAVFREWGVTVKELPPKMTDILQVMDLIANAPLKSAIRKMRAMGLFAYFQDWKVKRLLAEKDDLELPPFNPPKPTLVDGLQATFKCVESSLRSDSFKAAMRRTFVKVGLAPQEDDKFACYKAHKKAGWLKLEMLEMGTDRACMAERTEVDGQEEVTLGEIATEFVIAPRQADMDLAEELEERELGEEESEESEESD